MTGPDSIIAIGGKPNLRDRFNAARYGHYFRTSTFHNTLTGNREWLYAVQDPQSRRCILMKVHENEAGQDRIKIKDGMAFLDALDHMSRFEHPDANPNFLPVSADERKTLGSSHFQTFALNEGLIRDIQTGEFHPTLYGHVVTSGSFDPHELIRIEKIANGPHRTPESFIIPDHEGILKAGESSVEMILRMHKGLARISLALNLHNNLLKLAQIYDQQKEIDTDLYSSTKEAKMYEWEYRLDCCDDASKKNLETAIKSFNSGGLGKRLTRTYAAIMNDGKKSFPSFLHDFYLQKLKSCPPEHPDDMAEFTRILKLHELVFEHARCRNTYQYTLQYHSDEKVREARLECHQTSMKHLQKICHQLGFDEAQTGTAKAFVFSHEAFPYRRDIERFILSMRGARQVCQQNIENEKHSLFALAAKNMAPKNQ